MRLSRGASASAVASASALNAARLSRAQSYQLGATRANHASLPVQIVGLAYKRLVYALHDWFRTARVARAVLFFRG